METILTVQSVENRIMKKYAYLPLCVLVGSCAWFKGGTKNASGKKNTTPATTAATAPKPPVVPPNKNGVKPFDQVITKNLKKQTGLFNVYSSKELDSVFFEIGDALLGRDIMMINRVNRGPGGINMFSGEELASHTIYFEKGSNESIRVRFRMVIADADSSQVIARAVKQSNLDPVVITLPVKAYGKDSASYVLDMSRLLKDPYGFIQTIDKNATTALSTINKEQEVMNIKTFPLNVEVFTSRNSQMKDEPTKGLNGEPVTLEVKTSFIALPVVPMQRRIADPRVGYFADYVYMYSDDQQKTEVQRFVNRWRLEPKPTDAERYKRGELVEPAKPIIFYIDPATPKQWRKYLALGVSDWAKAFEKAGFKNAIIGKEWPEGDTTMDIDDARYSFIKYFPSEVANAYGPNVHDPRSGEIIQSNIGWYHNVMTLVHDWYMVQAGPNDAEARKATFSDELMGQLIRFVSSHEVGHTLGLRHNHISSSQTPVESMRNIDYLRKHGHTASIMDYARFNYVAQPEDNIPQELLFPRIGEYDDWAIEWGYKYNNLTVTEDKKALYKLTTEKLSSNNRLLFGSYETGSKDPRSQSEDLGDNVAKSNAYGIKNLKRVIAGLPEWTKTDDGFGQSIMSMYSQTANQYFRYVGHVIKNMGGIQTTIRTDSDPAPKMIPVSKEKQVDAMNFLLDEVLTTPTWLVDEKIADRVMLSGGGSFQNYVEDIQTRVVNTLLDAPVMQSIVVNEKRFGSSKTMGIDQYMSMLRNNVWKELNQPVVKVDGYRRAIQRSYVGALSFILTGTVPEFNESDAFHCQWLN